MSETTTIIENTTGESNGTTDTVNEVFDKLLEVFAFFRKIIDAIKGVITPLLESLLDSIG